MRKRLFLVIFTLFACQERVEEGERILFAYSILNPRYTNQLVIVDSLYDLGSELRDTAGVSGAQVFVVEEENKETTYFFETNKRGVYQDRREERWVKPLFTYHLFVIFGGDTLWGRTRVPDTFRIISPRERETIAVRDFDSIIWQESEGRKAYFLIIIHPDTTKPLIPVVTQDTAVDLRRWRDFYFDTTANYIIKVFAWDDNRYRYLVLKNSEPDTLGEGLGHFSSQTEDTVVINVQRTLLPNEAGFKKELPTD